MKVQVRLPKAFVWLPSRWSFYKRRGFGSELGRVLNSHPENSPLQFVRFQQLETPCKTSNPVIVALKKMVLSYVFQAFCSDWICGGVFQPFFMSHDLESFSWSSTIFAWNSGCLKGTIGWYIFWSIRGGGKWCFDQRSWTWLANWGFQKFLVHFTGDEGKFFRAWHVNS